MIELTIGMISYRWYILFHKDMTCNTFKEKCGVKADTTEYAKESVFEPTVMTKPATTKNTCTHRLDYCLSKAKNRCADYKDIDHCEKISFCQ